MKSKACILISIFSLSALANGALQSNDMIMKESLKRQGMPITSMDDSSRQAQEEPISTSSTSAIDRQDVQKMEEQIEVLERKVERLETNLARERSKMRQEQQEQKQQVVKVADSEKMGPKNLKGLVFSNELSSSSDRGSIGKFRIHEGSAEAIASYEDAPVETRSLPALKVCAVMADVNRMSVEDFAFLGMSRDAAMNAVSERMKRGEFTSSKQIAEIEGIGPEGFQKIEDEVIAIQSERFSE